MSGLSTGNLTNRERDRRVSRASRLIWAGSLYLQGWINNSNHQYCSGIEPGQGFTLTGALTKVLICSIQIFKGVLPTQKTGLPPFPHLGGKTRPPTMESASQFYLIRQLSKMFLQSVLTEIPVIYRLKPGILFCQ